MHCICKLIYVYNPYMYVVTWTAFPIILLYRQPIVQTELCGLSLTVAPAKLFEVRLRLLLLTVKATCILTLLRSTCFCLMRYTGSLSLFVSDSSRICCYTILPSLG